MSKVTLFKDGSEALVPASDDLECIAESLQVLAGAFTQVRAHQQLLLEAGVRLDRAGVALLFKLHLHRDDSFRVTELAEALGIDAPAVTRKVQQLERLGFVSREPDLEDRRATQIRLTSDGEETLERVLSARRKRLVRLFDGWTGNELRNFSASLSRFAGILTTELETDRG